MIHERNSCGILQIFVGCRLWPFRFASLGCLGPSCLDWVDVRAVKWPCKMPNNHQVVFKGFSFLTRMLQKHNLVIPRVSSNPKFDPCLCKFRSSALRCARPFEDFPWELCAMLDSRLRRRAWYVYTCIYIYIYYIYIYTEVETFSYIPRS